GRVSAAGAIDAAGTSFSVAHDLPPGAAVMLGIRPEALALTDGGAQAAAAGTIAGRVRLIEHLGADMLVQLDVADGRQPAAPPRAAARRPAAARRAARARRGPARPDHAVRRRRRAPASAWAHGGAAAGPRVSGAAPQALHARTPQGLSLRLAETLSAWILAGP